MHEPLYYAMQALPGWKVLTLTVEGQSASWTIRNRKPYAVWPSHTWGHGPPWAFRKTLREALAWAMAHQGHLVVWQTREVPLEVGGHEVPAGATLGYYMFHFGDRPVLGLDDAWVSWRRAAPATEEAGERGLLT